MGKLLRELLDEADAGQVHRAERHIEEVCLRPDLVAEVQRIAAEIDAVEDRPRRARKMSEGEPAELVELRAELGRAVEGMAEYEGTLTMRATKTDGEWRRWCNEHPARAEGEPGYDRDQSVTGLFCDADALLDDLGTYAARWNDEDLAPGDFDRLGVPGPYLRKCARQIIGMYETDADLGKVRRGLSATLAAEELLRQRATSGSPSDAFSDGNPPSDTSTTTSAAS